MILYFSATGNSKYVALRIYTSTGEEPVNIEGFSRGVQPVVKLGPGEMLGIVCPAYAGRIPLIVERFLQEARFELPTAAEVAAAAVASDPHPTVASLDSAVPKVEEGGAEGTGADGGDSSAKGSSECVRPYTFAVCTYGNTPGYAGRVLANIMSAKGLPLDARYSVRMPDTYTPIFDVSDQAEVEQVLEGAEELIGQVIESVRNRYQGNYMDNELKFPGSALTRPIYNRIRKTSKFRVSNACTECGLCAQRCPDNVIAFQNHKPKWLRDRCEMCLRCLHLCPQFAISRGKRTRRHGQYTNPRVDL